MLKASAKSLKGDQMSRLHSGKIQCCNESPQGCASPLTKLTRASVCHQAVLACILDHWKSRLAAAVSHGLQLLKYSDGLNVFLVAEVDVF